MSTSIKKFITILIGFTHDFAAGCWVATVLATYWLERKSLEYPQVLLVLEDIQRRFFYIGLACVATVLTSGAGRTFTYVSNIYGEDAEKTRKRMLIIKHVVLFLIFGLGIYWQYMMVFR